MWAGAARRRSGCTRARWSPCRRPSRRGIGIRVVSGHRQGFAYAGSLDADVIAETLEEARDNAGFASPDEWVGLARPDGVAPADLDLWRDDLAAYPTDVKVARALELERAVRDGDPRIRAVESAEWGDAAVESAVATSTGIRASSRRTACYLSAYAIAGEGADTQTGSGYSVGRSPADLDLDKAAVRRRAAGHPPARRGQAPFRSPHRGVRARDHRHPALGDRRHP